MWDSVTGECLEVFSDHKRPVYALSFSPDGHWLATGSGDGWLHVYNILVRIDDLVSVEGVLMDSRLARNDGRGSQEQRSLAYLKLTGRSTKA